MVVCTTSQNSIIHKGQQPWELEPALTAPTVGENDPRAVTCDVLFLFRLICDLVLGSQTLSVLQCLPTEISDKEQTSQHLFLLKKNPTQQQTNHDKTQKYPNPTTKNNLTTVVACFCFQVSPFQSHRQEANSVLLQQRATEVAGRPPSLFPH